MLKRIFFVIAASLLTLAAVGCACDGGVVSPSPTASMKPIETPAAAVTTPGTELSASPDASTSPGTGTGASNAIPNFQEGTEVQSTELPEIKTAIETKYSGATIKSIKHALKDGQQVYEVELEQNGTTQKIYVQPDGTMLPDSNAAS